MQAHKVKHILNIYMFHPYLMTSSARQGAYVQKSDPRPPSPLSTSDLFRLSWFGCWIMPININNHHILAPSLNGGETSSSSSSRSLSPPSSLRQMQSGCCATTSSLPLSSSSLLVFYISPKRKRKEEEEEGSLITDQSPFLFPLFLTLPPPLQCAVLSYSWLGGSEMIVDVWHPAPFSSCVRNQSFFVWGKKLFSPRIQIVGSHLETQKFSTFKLFFCDPDKEKGKGGNNKSDLSHISFLFSLPLSPLRCKINISLHPFLFLPLCTHTCGTIPLVPFL